MTLFIDERNQIYEVGYFERTQFNRVRNAIAEIDHAIAKGEKEVIHSFPRFARELFNRLYSYGFCHRVPQILPEDEWAATLHAQFDDDPDFHYLGKLVVNDAYLSGRSSASFLQTLLQNLPKPEQPLEDPNQLREQVAQAVEQAQELEATNPELAESIKQSVEQMIEQGKKMVAQHQDFAQQIAENPISPTEHAAQYEAQEQQRAEADSGEPGELGEPDEAGAPNEVSNEAGESAASSSSMPGNGTGAPELDESVAIAVQAAMQAAIEEAEEAAAEQAGFGSGLEAGTGQGSLNLEEKQLIGKRLQNDYKLKRIAQLAGRMKRIAARKQRSNCVEANNRIVAVEAGRNIKRLVSAEYLKLRAPAMQTIFYKEYSEGRLLQFKMGGKEKASRGPIIVCMDCSGSMEGHSDVWSKSVGLAMLGIAQKEKRKTRFVHFDTQVTRTDDFDPKEKGVKLRRKMLENMSHFTNGGTNWEAPLRSALEAIQRDRRYKQADVIFITDGQDTLDASFVDEFNRQRKKLEFTVYPIIIGDDYRYGIEFLSQIADEQDFLFVERLDASQADKILAL